MSIIDWPGLSGKTYRYWINPIGETFKDEAGNYGFVKQLPNGNFVPLYFGEAESLRNRLSNHERWAEAVRLGVTHFVTHTTLGGLRVRLAEERDLIQRWNPPMNVQHRRAI